MATKGVYRRNWLGAAGVLLAALASISCGREIAQVGKTSGSGTAKTASITLNASSVDFGNVSMGSSKTSAVTLTNSSASGGPSVTLMQASAGGTGFTAGTSGLPLVLSPGEATTITVTFAPNSAGAASGSLSIAVSGATNPKAVSLSGIGMGLAQLGVAPATLSFGNVAVGSSANLSGTLTAGSSSVTVSSANWNGQGYSVSGISFPLNIPAGASIPFTVTFAPQATGSAAGSIAFASNATNSPATEAFTGAGTQALAAPTVQHTVDLSWLASTSPVTGYNVYRGTQSGGPYAKMESLQPTTSFADSTVQSGATYYYAVTSVDASEVESAYSNQVAVTVPTP